MKPESTELVEARWTQAVLAVASAVAAMTLAECTWRVWYDNYWMYAPNPSFTNTWFPPILFMFIGSVPAAFALKHSQGIALALAGITITALVVVNFRGSHRWVGLAEMKDQSLAPLAIGLLASVAAAFLLKNLKYSTLTTMTFLIMLFGFSWSIIDWIRPLRLMTFVPYTRHGALGLIALLIIVAMIVDLLGDRYEKA